jgi:hypothetical protein
MDKKSCITLVPVCRRQLLVAGIWKERHLAAGERNALEGIGWKHEAVVAKI